MNQKSFIRFFLEKHIDIYAKKKKKRLKNNIC